MTPHELLQTMEAEDCWPEIYLPSNQQRVVGEDQWRSYFAGQPRPYDLNHIAASWPQIMADVRRQREWKANEAWADKQRTNPDPNAFDGQGDALLKEIREEVRFRKTDSGRLERIISLLEQLVDRGRQ
jgi:hypothetical protein